MKRAAGILAALLCCFMLTGCGASLNWYYDVGEDGNTVYTFEIEVPDSVRTTLENSASDMPQDLIAPVPPQKWTLQAYLLYLGHAFGYDYKRMYTQSGKTVYQLDRVLPPQEDDDEDADSDVTQVVKDYFYVYTVEITQPNPFNGLRDEYDNDTYEEGTILDVLKNGYADLPAITEAFPAIAQYKLDDFKLNFFFGSDAKMATTGRKISIGGHTYYLWERKFDTKDETLSYLYYRPNTLGWNITAIVVAGIVVAVILLATRKKKKKPTLEERFPYDPSNESGGNYPRPFNY